MSYNITDWVRWEALLVIILANSPPQAGLPEQVAQSSIR